MVEITNHIDYGFAAAVREARLSLAERRGRLDTSDAAPEDCACELSHGNGAEFLAEASAFRVGGESEFLTHRGRIARRQSQGQPRPS